MSDHKDDMPDQPNLNRLISELKNDVDDLKARLAIADGLLRALQSAQAAAVNGRPVTALGLLEKSKDQIAAAEPCHPEAVAASKGLWQALSAEADAQVAEVVSDLPTQLEAAGLQIDLASRFPNFSVNGRLVAITVESRKRQALVQARHGIATRTPLDVKAVVESVIEQVTRLTEREFDEERFFHTLLGAIREAGGERRAVPLREVAKKMPGGGKKKQCAVDEFAVDLGTLLRSPGLSDRKPRLKVNHTRDEREGLHLFGLESGGLVGTIEIDGGTK